MQDFCINKLLLGNNKLSRCEAVPPWSGKASLREPISAALRICVNNCETAVKPPTLFSATWTWTPKGLHSTTADSNNPPERGGFPRPGSFPRKLIRLESYRFSFTYSIHLSLKKSTSFTFASYTPLVIRNIWGFSSRQSPMDSRLCSRSLCSSGCPRIYPLPASTPWVLELQTLITTTSLALSSF